MESMDDQETKQQLWIDTFGHLRHEWMNDLQIILGYIHLKKYDKVSGFVELLKQKLMEESRFAKIGHPRLVGALLTFRTQIMPVQFRLTVEDEWNRNVVAGDGESLDFAVRIMLSAFENAMTRRESGSYPQLHCRIRQELNTIMIRIFYDGFLQEQTLMRAATEVCHYWEKIRYTGKIETHFGMDKGSITLYIPTITIQPTGGSSCL
jgi:sensor histidine kinase regulating citrate/malate metabolism